MLKELEVKPNEDIRFAKRDVFSDKYDYEAFNYAMCVTCAYFTFDNTKENVEWQGKNICGNCRLIKSLGAYEGVLSTAVCNKFLSHHGYNIKQKHASKKELPDFVELVKGEEGKYSVVFTNGA